MSATVRPVLTARLAGAVTAVVLLLAGCAGDAPRRAVNVSRSGDAVGGSATAGEPGRAVGAGSVESCRELPQRPAATRGSDDRLPALRLPCLGRGPDVELAALGGKPVLVNLWATWCEPCRAEMPLLQAAHGRHGDTVQFLGVDTQDNAEAAVEFLSQLGVTYPQVVDADGALLRRLGVPGLPVTVMLDDRGVVTGKHIGELERDDIKRLVGSAR